MVIFGDSNHGPHGWQVGVLTARLLKYSTFLPVIVWKIDLIWWRLSILQPSITYACLALLFIVSLLIFSSGLLGQQQNYYYGLAIIKSLHFLSSVVMIATCSSHLTITSFFWGPVHLYYKSIFVYDKQLNWALCEARQKMAPISEQ